MNTSVKVGDTVSWSSLGGDSQGAVVHQPNGTVVVRRARRC